VSRTRCHYCLQPQSDMAFVSVCVGVLRGLMLRLLSWAKENPKTCVLYFSSFTISSLIQCIMVYRLLVRTAPVLQPPMTT
jgi:hypothetical protein